MGIIYTADVFTPAKLPEVTEVDRTDITGSLANLVRRGGFIVSLLGSTKLGKTTLVKGFLASLTDEAWSTYIGGQSITNGAGDLWIKLANTLQIPTSKVTGLASSDTATWGFITKLRLSIFPGAGIDSTASIQGAHERGSSSSETFTLDPQVAVTEALNMIRKNKRTVVISIDDFHFVTDVDERRTIILALRTLTDLGCAAILSTILGGRIDPAFSNTNTGGRRKKVEVTRWATAELVEIAKQGLPALNLWAAPELIQDLAEQSFGSPQIMQQLCLELCETENGFIERDTDGQMEELKPPKNRKLFYRSIEDDEASDWVKKLAAGPNPRKSRRRRDYPSTPPVALDGYQLILRAMHDLGSPQEVPVTEIKRHIGEKLNLDPTALNALALETKVRNLSLLASRDTKDALDRATANMILSTTDDGGDEASEEVRAHAELLASEAIPQPVFEVQGEDNQATIHVLDPYVSYMLMWHPEAIIEGGRK